MRKTFIAASVLSATALLGSNLALAESPISGNVTFVSDYILRGVSYSAGKPAIQGSLDYTHASGFYAGIWGSSVSDKSLGDIGSNGMEIDVYLGYAGEVGAFGYDIGAVRYIYPSDLSSSDTDSTELYIGMSWEFLGLSYARDIDLDTDYLELTASYEVMTDLSLDMSVGYMDPDEGETRTDWSIGVTKNYAGIDFGLHYVDSNRSGDYSDVNNAVVLSISKSF